MDGAVGILMNLSRLKRAEQQYCLSPQRLSTLEDLNVICGFFCCFFNSHPSDIPFEKKETLKKFNFSNHFLPFFINLIVSDFIIPKLEITHILFKCI